MKKIYKKKQFLEDIYDYLKECAMPVRQNDDYAKLSRYHALEARKGLRRFLKTKTMEWDPVSNTIKIGRDIILRLEVLR